MSNHISCAVLAAAVKIGRPGYRVTKQFDQDTQQRSLLFQVGGRFGAYMHGTWLLVQKLLSRMVQLFVRV